MIAILSLVAPAIIIAKTICRSRRIHMYDSFVRLFRRGTHRGEAMLPIRFTKSIPSRTPQGPSPNIAIQLLISFPLLASRARARAVLERFHVHGGGHAGATGALVIRRGQYEDCDDEDTTVGRPRSGNWSTRRSHAGEADRYREFLDSAYTRGKRPAD